MGQSSSRRTDSATGGPPRAFTDAADGAPPSRSLRHRFLHRQADQGGAARAASVEHGHAAITRSDSWNSFTGSPIGVVQATPKPPPSRTFKRRWSSFMTEHRKSWGPATDGPDSLGASTTVAGIDSSETHADDTAEQICNPLSPNSSIPTPSPRPISVRKRLSRVIKSPNRWSWAPSSSSVTAPAISEIGNEARHTHIRAIRRSTADVIEERDNINARVENEPDATENNIAGPSSGRAAAPTIESRPDKGKGKEKEVIGSPQEAGTMSPDLTPKAEVAYASPSTPPPENDPLLEERRAAARTILANLPPGVTVLQEPDQRNPSNLPMSSPNIRPGAQAPVSSTSAPRAIIPSSMQPNPPAISVDSTLSAVSIGPQAPSSTPPSFAPWIEGAAAAAAAHRASSARPIIPLIAPQPAPAIPSGTTMIVQGVVHTTEQAQVRPHQHTPTPSRQASSLFGSSTTGRTPADGVSVGDSIPTSLEGGESPASPNDRPGSATEAPDPEVMHSIDMLAMLLSVVAAATGASLMSGTTTPFVPPTDTGNSNGVLPTASENPFNPPTDIEPTSPLPEIDPSSPVNPALGAAARGLLNIVRDRLFRGSGVRARSSASSSPSGSPSSSTPNLAEHSGSSETNAAPSTVGGENTSAVPVASTPAAPIDHMELLRTNIAHEFTRALARRTPSTDGSITPLATPPPEAADPSSIPLPASGRSSPAPRIVTPPSISPATSLPTTSAPSPTSPIQQTGPEGSFEQFLHDIQLDLRVTLTERYARDRERERRSARTVADEAASLLSAAIPSSHAIRPVGVTTPPPIPTAPVEVTQNPGPSNPPETTASTPVPIITPDAMTQPIPIISPLPAHLQTHIPTVDSPLNWWRMYRFPPRTAGASAPSTSTPGPSSTSSPIPSPMASPIWPPAANPTNPANSNLVPVIVVGLRSTRVEELPPLPNLTRNIPPPRRSAPFGRPTPLSSPAATETPTPSTLSQPATSLPESTPSPIRPSEALVLPYPGADDEPDVERWPARGRTLNPREFDEQYPPSEGHHAWAWSSRASRALARNRLEREREQLERERDMLERILERERQREIDLQRERERTLAGATARESTRSYVIWVIGGYYPDHVLMTPNIMLGQFDHDDFWALAELLGQVKPPVASKDDIERSGLVVIKSEQLQEYAREDKISSNTVERCLICLGDYEPEEDLRILTCRHGFHKECVDKWLEVGRNNCPACRTKGVSTEDRPPASPVNPSAANNASY